MYPPLIDKENVLARQNEMLQAAERYRQAKKLAGVSPTRWPRLGNLFARRKATKQQGVVPQASHL